MTTRIINNDIIFSVLEATQRAAIASFDWIGRGNNESADRAAVNAMRSAFNQIDFQGNIVIGEGERDKAPMLYIAEKIGLNNSIGPEIDIAVDPLEGTNICAEFGYNAISVATITHKGGLLHAPDLYMKKIAIADHSDTNIIDIDKSVAINLNNLAEVRGCKVSDLTVTVLRRERHKDLIAEIRDIGAKIKFIDDGDICAIMELHEGLSDMYIGIGGAPEGVIAASILKCMGGEMYGKLIFKDDADIKRSAAMGISDVKKIYNIDDMVSSYPVFIASGVTDGSLFDGVVKDGDVGHRVNSKIISPDFYHEITSTI